ncbi:FKBP-type peptidyl-prolyl cis-trans isomerase [Fulvivirga sp. 29W222]|uniref:Peptidyl-prolyl cis-trans isomerase n=1 Tax=Fulvivirga marina TaxID=2494733 RepID=A0A937FUJ7_9BACT|nr:FKBP-type peptidyl-prolyl cis-trans isomerase [Fulvivirga marina]MBL6444732.1 FKBP-type peptidyl-prolyl cis-trans isomerase [Fulvivirga marina]
MITIRPITYVIGMSLLISFFTSCKEEETQLERWRREEDEKITKYLTDNNISATKDASGIYYEVLGENAQGRTVKTNDIISVFYDIKTLEGKLLEKTTDSLAPVMFLHDYRSVIPLGLDYAVHLMKEGEKYRFYIPSSLAYGEYKSDDFDANSIFIIELQVADVQTLEERNSEEVKALGEYLTSNAVTNKEELSSGLIYNQKIQGTGIQPTSQSRVKIHYECRYLDSTLVDKTNPSQPVIIDLNGGYIVKGLKEGILKMKEGGKSTLIMPSKLAFGGSIQVFPASVREELIQDQVLLTRVLPFSPLVYEVELVDTN